MTVTNVKKDAEFFRLSITAEFDAPIEQVWELWENPRLLEQWWGPPTYPATIVDSNLTPGGVVNYYMTGPEGDQPHGWWRVIAVEAPHNLEFEDGFADEQGVHDLSMPTMMNSVTLSERSEGSGTRMAIVTEFASKADMDQMIKMGMDEGFSLAVGQMDELLNASHSPGR